MSRESRLLSLRLALRAIRWRAAASVTVFVVAVVAVFAATVGPIYLPAVDQAVLVRHLKDASLSQRDVLISRHTQLAYPHYDWDAQVQGLAGQLARDPAVPRAEVRSRVAAVLQQVGLIEVADHLIEELSGGQQQRVAVARALVTSADVLLADEPSAGACDEVLDL